MNSKLLPVLFFFLLAGAAIAQPRIVTYHKSNGKVVSNRDSADYEKIVTRPDSGSVLFNVTENYMNGNIKLKAKSTKIPTNSWEGLVTSYYKSGKVEQTCFYKSGKLTGEFSLYFPNGKLYCVRDYIGNEPAEGGNSVGNFTPYLYLIKTCNDSVGHPLVKNGNGHYIGYLYGFKGIFEDGDVKEGKRDGVWHGKLNGKDSVTFTEKYEIGTLIEGKSVNKITGQTFTYRYRETNPQYTGGEAAFGEFLRSNIRYPVDARTKNIQGRVFISFVVEKNGSLTDVKILRAPSLDLGQEAMNVISMSPNWVPGTQYGQPVRVQYTVPVNFSLNGN